MKKNVIFLICLMLSVVVFGQSETKNPVKKVEGSPAKFININSVAVLNKDNTDLLNAYLKKNLNYPKESAKCFKDGAEVVQFTVTPSGNVTNVKVINSICPEIDKDVIRVLENTDGMWIPSVNSAGEPTAMTTEIKIPYAFCNECNVASTFTRKGKMYYNAGVKNLMVKNKPEKALHFFNMSMKYLPNDNALLSIRGLCYYELGDIESANKDWIRAESLGGTIPKDREFDYKLSSLKGYAEMANVFDKQKNN